MDMDEDDPMEIDDSLPATPIIERRTDSLSVEVDTTNTTALSAETSNQEDPKNAHCNDADIVILDDDDEPVKEKMKNPKQTPDPKSTMIQPVKEIIDLVDKPHNNRCLNTSCISTSNEFILAPDFCLSYFRVKRSKTHKEEICKACYTKSVEDFDELSTTLKNGKLILGVNYPIINETLQIDDSDEEDDETEDMEYIENENFDFISENIDELLQTTLDDLKLENHFKHETEYLMNASKRVEEESADLSKKVIEIRSVLDGIQLNLYNQFRPDFRALKGLTIIDDYNQSPNTIIKIDNTTDTSPRKSARSHKPVSYVEIDDPSNSNSPKVVADPEPPKDLPPILPVDRPQPVIGETYYIVRENSQGSWIRGRLLAILPPAHAHNGPASASARRYKLVELKQQRERLLDGRHVAYATFCKVRLPVGTRVISVFKETGAIGEQKKPRHDPFYAGIVAEQPFEGNKFRYLIFFDIGYSQYVSYHSVNLVMESSPDVWEDVYVESRPFIKKYLESQDRPMVKLAKDQTVRVEYKGKWWLCTVMNVDCSLVQVFFDSLSRTEWIYRGSTRLSPMFREEQAATNRHTGVRTSRKLGHNESATVVQYTRNQDFVQSPTRVKPEEESPSNVRAVARKSTTKPQGVLPAANIVPFLPPVNNAPATTGPTSKIMYFTPRDQVIIRRAYRPHTCSAKCKDLLTHNFGQLRGHNPLSKPLLCGWGRMTLKVRGRKEIAYKAPCGRLLRDIAEVHHYLRLTGSEMTVDLFDFNHMVRCLAEFSVECNPEPKDLSRGLEQVPIPVINGINNEMLDFCNYSTKRVPMEGVHMNTDKEFLCGCDCDDDCIDKTKCACWRLSLEGAKYIGKEIDPNSVGYIYRRLPEQVITGIYECNSRCKCNSTCLNRVVQNPMTLKLQVFRTHNRGWGIRCLNDVPQGSFICIYAGTLHTEAMANEDGIAYGDEYFAELDYIETVEKFKEDYEAETMEDDEEEEPRYRGRSPEEEEEEEQAKVPSKSRRYNYTEDNDFTPAYHFTTRGGESGIRSRLRRRNNEDENKPEPKSDLKPELKPVSDVKIKKELMESTIDIKAALNNLGKQIETVTISDEEDEGREVLSFNPKASGLDLKTIKYPSVRELFGEEECVYVMDAKNAGNIGRFLNHSCSPNVFVQNVFVDTHDPRFPWVSFFSSQFIRAGTELTWNYNYDIGSVPGRVLYCHCASLECKGRLL